ncbi:ectonucleotide pyrophosphatase/phosphodiesterase [Sphingomonas sp.]|uniref:alkaline phosphatase family protein n=1 Tax=Sphingomonas sp. TaxID=28214 RepID=UPI001B01B273|nr:ectonucleotide pyrophosphatase/phosphodiesterase [Sphingomonas sp.]MBO9713632.1 alkaline phosphatase family protein [Sphingomonas sp.]
MHWFVKVAAAALAAILPVSASAQPPAAAEHREPVVILISIDGFRADYLDRGITPNLSALAAEGVRAPMRPSFPSKTAPNHYAIATGLRPDRNGIVANAMEDPEHPRRTFSMKATESYWWDEAEPIWVAAEEAGIRSGTMFWPGSAAKVRGVYASDWWPYQIDVPEAQRVSGVIDWLRRPDPAERPKLVTLYFDTVDTAGHDFGPDAPETGAAIRAVDAQIGRLRAGLAALDQPANLVLVADHGMAAISQDRVIRLKDLVDPAAYHLVEDGPFAALAATEGRQAELEAALLKPHDHMRCWRKADIPARFHYGRNPRVAPYFCLADLGWQIEAKPHGRDWKPDHGSHGWDNDLPEMRALFVASGPAFARGKVLPAFDNVDVYALLRDLIGLPPASGIDGSDAPFRGVLLTRTSP